MTNWSTTHIFCSETLLCRECGRPIYGEAVHFGDMDYTHLGYGLESCYVKFAVKNENRPIDFVDIAYEHWRGEAIFKSKQLQESAA